MGSTSVTWWVGGSSGAARRALPSRVREPELLTTSTAFLALSQAPPALAMKIAWTRPKNARAMQKMTANMLILP